MVDLGSTFWLETIAAPESPLLEGRYAAGEMSPPDPIADFNLGNNPLHWFLDSAEVVPGALLS